MVDRCGDSIRRAAAKHVLGVSAGQNEGAESWRLANVRDVIEGIVSIIIAGRILQSADDDGEIAANPQELACFNLLEQSGGAERGMLAVADHDRARLGDGP